MPAAKKRKALPVGARGHAIHKGRAYQIEVVQTNGGLAYKVGRSVFSSPSGAAKSITGRETNGWQFWHLDGE
jgi:hypothetical protein